MRVTVEDLAVVADEVEVILGVVVAEVGFEVVDELSRVVVVVVDDG